MYGRETVAARQLLGTCFGVRDNQGQPFGERVRDNLLGNPPKGPNLLVNPPFGEATFYKIHLLGNPPF